MELILWRHAEAEEGIPDAARELTEKGLQQAKKMSQWLKARLPKNTRVIVSPTIRTQQTARALDSNFEIKEELAPGASVNKVLSAANWPEADGAVVVVGHQPTLGEVAAALISNVPADLSFKKGAVWWFSYNFKEEDPAEPILRTVIYPDIL